MRKLTRILFSLIAVFAIVLVVLLLPGTAIATSYTFSPAQNTDTFRAGYTGSAWASTTDYISVGYSTSGYYRMRTGLRFTGVTIPRNATIVSANIRLTAYPATSSQTAVNSVLQGEYSDNPSSFSNYNDFAARPKTSASVYWDSIPVWVSESAYASPDISSIIREIVSRPNWTPGNSIVIFWGDEADRTSHTNATYRIAYSFSASIAKAPTLQVDYIPPAAPVVPQPTPTPPATVLSLADVSNQVTNLSNQVTKLQSQIAGMQSTLGSTTTDKTVASLSTALTQVTQTANTINSGVTNMATKVNQLNESQGKLQADLNNTRAEMKTMSERVATLQSQATTQMVVTGLGLSAVIVVIGVVALFIKRKLL